jgi:hypothetical protein
MLANAVAGRPLEHGVPRPQPFGPFSTVQALHRKGMLAGINHLPTAAGRAALATPGAPAAPATTDPAA